MAHAANLNAYADYVERPALLARLRRSIADHREYRAAHKALNALSDRQLADIGLSRLHLRDVARATIHAD